MQHLTCYPITHGSRKLVNLGAICSWSEKENTVSTEYMDVCPGDKEEARAYFAGWETEVRQLLEVSRLSQTKRIEAGHNLLTGLFYLQCSETVTRWPMMLLSPLPISSHGHIAIIGDAVSFDQRPLLFFTSVESEKLIHPTGTCDDALPSIRSRAGDRGK